MARVESDSERQIRRLRFEGPAEYEFQVSFAEDSLLRLRVVLGLLALLTLPPIVFGIRNAANLQGPGDTVSPLNLARLLTGGPIPLTIIALSFWRRFRRYAVMAVVAFQLLMHALPVIYREKLPDQTPHVAYTFVSAILVIAAMRLPTIMAALYAAATWVLSHLLLLANTPRSEFPTSSLFLMFGMMLLIVGAYYNETAARRTYLLGRMLEQERAKTEAVLANTLPKAIAERLKNSSEPIAEFHPDVTVLFADVVDFTPFAAAHPPGEVVALLNNLFSRFDGLVSNAELEKIKTVGDAYMVVGGLPSPKLDHAQATADLALEMLGAAAQLGIKIRIGIDTGPVVAGVLGTTKHSYDLWGTTVNRAARMESHGRGGAIHVTDAFVGAAGAEFEFVSHGVLELKGLGEVSAHWLVRRKNKPLPLGAVAVKDTLRA